jgi:uncharacterized protein (TIGR02118 family)
MIKATAFYPHEENKRFDVNYYLGKHIPMVKKLLGDICKKVEVEKGISGTTHGSAPAHTIIGCLYFDSIEDFQNSFAANANEILSDVANFTNINPTIQISEILL